MHWRVNNGKTASLGFLWHFPLSHDLGWCLFPFPQILGADVVESPGGEPVWCLLMWFLKASSSLRWSIALLTKFKNREWSKLNIAVSPGCQSRYIKKITQNDSFWDPPKHLIFETLVGFWYLKTFPWWEWGGLAQTSRMWTLNKCLENKWKGVGVLERILSWTGTLVSLQLNFLSDCISRLCWSVWYFLGKVLWTSGKANPVLILQHQTTRGSLSQIAATDSVLS